MPFAIGAVVALLAFVIMSLPGLRQIEMAQQKHSNFLRMMRLSPIAMGTTAINSAVETAGLSFLAIYAMRLGWNETEGAQLITVLMVGAIALQLPIGWLSDKMNRVTLMIALTAVSAITAFLWPLLLSVSWLAYPALFIWGGIFVGIYTTMLAIIGSQFRGADLISVYAAMGLFWGGGALVGPMLAGGFLDVMQHGLPTFVGMVCVVFMVFALIVKRTLKPSGDPRHDTHRSYSPWSRNYPAALENTAHYRRRLASPRHIHRYRCAGRKDDHSVALFGYFLLPEAAVGLLAAAFSQGTARRMRVVQGIALFAVALLILSATPPATSRLRWCWGSASLWMAVCALAVHGLSAIPAGGWG